MRRGNLRVVPSTTDLVVGSLAEGTRMHVVAEMYGVELRQVEQIAQRHAARIQALQVEMAHAAAVRALLAYARGMQHMASVLTGERAPDAALLAYARAATSRTPDLLTELLARRTPAVESRPLRELTLAELEVLAAQADDREEGP